MSTQKLTATDGFVVVDLEGAEHAFGVVRLAPKILLDGANLLARSVTYQCALFEQRVSGASAGINSKPDDREAAVSAFVSELLPLVEKGALSIDAGKGVEPGELEPLRDVDPRPPLATASHAELTAASVAAAADAALGGLDGRTVAIEGFDAAGPVAVAVAARLVGAGAAVTTVATATGSVSQASGFDPAALAAAFEQHGAAMVGELGPEVGKAWAATAAEADVLLAGSKAGVITHTNADHVQARAVVPIGRVPVSAKALAMLRRAGTVVVPDFASLAGPGLVAWPTGVTPTSIEDAVALVDESVRTVVAEHLGHEDGPLLSACYRAEVFLGTWRESLPFGRPIA